jgi:hypothetical protein
VTAKLALCEQAEALADSTDWNATTTVMKRLQAEWKKSGPVPRAEGEALWQRFRTACDRFFERRSRRDELAQEGLLQQAGAICDQLDALRPRRGGDAPHRKRPARRWTRPGGLAAAGGRGSRAQSR